MTCYGCGRRVSELVTLAHTSLGGIVCSSSGRRQNVLMGCSIPAHLPEFSDVDGNCHYEY